MMLSYNSLLQRAAGIFYLQLIVSFEYGSSIRLNALNRLV